MACRKLGGHRGPVLTSPSNPVWCSHSSLAASMNVANSALPLLFLPILLPAGNRLDVELGLSGLFLCQPQEVIIHEAP